MICSTEELRAATWALSELSDGSVVVATLDGRSVLMAFRPQIDEHRRREREGLGAVISRRSLHALWDLPQGLGWPLGAVDALDEQTLRAEGRGLARFDAETITREYEPAGTVEALAVVRHRLRDAVDAIRGLPPTVQRYAIAATRSRADAGISAMADRMGVGTVILDGVTPVPLNRAAPAHVGVPGIYRWWLAEVAYGSWLQAPNAH
jgi:hypothetical protein